MQLTIQWADDMAFEVDPPSGNKFTMDATPDSGGRNLGPTPVEALIASAGACMAMDVISILKKKKQVVTGYRLEVEWDRGPEGEYPRPVTAIRIKHFVTGENVSPEAVARAVQLSDEKYCTVVSTLRTSPTVSSEWTIA